MFSEQSIKALSIAHSYLLYTLAHSRLLSIENTVAYTFVGDIEMLQRNSAKLGKWSKDEP